MSKPGGKPIVKKRPFFKDDFFSVFVNETDSAITSFEFHDLKRDDVFISKVKDNKILEAWQKLENHANGVIKKYLIKIDAKIKGPYPLKRKSTKRRSK